MTAQPVTSTSKISTDNRYASTVGYNRNNPGNLSVQGIPYQGKAHDQPKKGPVTFVDQRSGLRALAMDVKMKLKHTITVNDYAAKYAPPNENDTEAYAKYLSAHLDLETNHNIPNDNDTQFKLMDAIIKKEIGFGTNPYSDDDLKQAIEDAKTPSTDTSDAGVAAGKK